MLKWAFGEETQTEDTFSLCILRDIEERKSKVSFGFLELFFFLNSKKEILKPGKHLREKPFFLTRKKR